MAKRMSFADKAKKEKQVVNCPVCSSAITPTLVFKAYRSQTSGNWKFKKVHLGVCKCNHKEVYG